MTIFHITNHNWYHFLASAIVLICGLFILMGWQSNASALSGSDFHAGHIIDDDIFTNSNALSVQQIQNFLNAKVGTCDTNGTQPSTHWNSAAGRYYTHAEWGALNGNPAPYTCINQYVENTSTLQNNYHSPATAVPGGISAAQIIWNAAQAYQINPEVILTTLQKEQGLITDNWPWYTQYKFAMGYSCPDSGSGCSSNYADFYKQIDGAAWQLRYYLTHPGAFNYWTGNNFIRYNPNANCGGTVVNIFNPATAALYIYTPYQPNNAALSKVSDSNAGGTGDACSAYGNRNFWWYFNTWFGTSLDNISLAKSSDNPTVYVLYDGIKQGIPSPDVLIAWGLDRYTIQVLDPSTLPLIPTASTPLTRFVQNRQTGMQFFIDASSYRAVPSVNEIRNWTFLQQTVATVSNTLMTILQNGGLLKNYITVNGNPTIYAMNDGTLHAITNGSLYTLWAGQNYSAMPLSSDYFSSLTQGAAVGSPLVSYGGTSYALSDGQALPVISSIASLLPASWQTIPVSQGLFGTFSSGGSLQYMIKDGSPTVYLLDNGTKRPITDGQTYDAYRLDGSGNTSNLSPTFINYISSGSPLSRNLISLGGQYYVVNHGLQPVTGSLITAYGASTNSLALQSTAYHVILPTLASPTVFVKSSSNPTIYFLSGGQKLPFSNPATLTLLGANVITNLTNNTMSIIGSGPVMQNYVTDGSANYLIDKTKFYSVAPTSASKVAWGLPAPTTINSASLAAFSNGGALSQHLQLPSGFFCLIDSSTRYCAGQPAMITLWELTENIIHPSQELVDYYRIADGGGLTRFVWGKSGEPYAGTLLTAAQGKLWGVQSMDNALNLGFNGGAIRLAQTTIADLINPQVWQGYLAQDDDGNKWILDGGSRRSLPSSYNTAWTTGTTVSSLGSAYLSFIPAASDISNAIKAPSDPTIYGMRNGQKYGVPSPQAYDSSGLAAPTNVSDSLARSIPTGGIW